MSVAWDSSEYGGDGYYWVAQALGVDLTSGDRMDPVNTMGYGPVLLFANFENFTSAGSPDIRLQGSNDLDLGVWSTAWNHNIGNGTLMKNHLKDGNSWRYMRRWATFQWDACDTGTADFYMKIVRTDRTG